MKISINSEILSRALGVSDEWNFTAKIKLSKNGREIGIRTPGGFRLNGFQDRRFRPLSHLPIVKKYQFRLKFKHFERMQRSFGLFFDPTRASIYLFFRPIYRVAGIFFDAVPGIWAAAESDQNNNSYK